MSDEDIKFRYMAGAADCPESQSNDAGLVLGSKAHQRGRATRENRFSEGRVYSVALYK